VRDPNGFDARKGIPSNHQTRSRRRAKGDADDAGAPPARPVRTRSGRVSRRIACRVGEPHPRLEACLDLLHRPPGAAYTIRAGLPPAMAAFSARAARDRSHAYGQSRNIGPLGCEAGRRAIHLPYVARIRIQWFSAADRTESLYRPGTPDGENH